MVKDAEAHKAEDEKRGELIEARNHADGLVHSTESQLKEHGDKVDADLKGRIKAAIADLKGVMDGEDVSAIKAKAEALGQVAMKMGEALYKSQQEPGAAGATADAGAAAEGADGSSSGAKTGDDNVVDADFEEVDDTKRSAS
jgi:molecular chaperone DnaK